MFILYIYTIILLTNHTLFGIQFPFALSFLVIYSTYLLYVIYNSYILHKPKYRRTYFVIRYVSDSPYFYLFQFLFMLLIIYSTSQNVYLLVGCLLTMNSIFIRPIAIWAASTGRLKSWIPWACVPLYPFIWLYMYSRINQIARTKRSSIVFFFEAIDFNIIKTVGLTIAGSILIGGFFAFITFKFNFFITNFILFISAASLIILTIRTIYRDKTILKNSLRSFYKALHDRWHWQTHNSRNRKNLTYQEFWRNVELYYNVKYRIQVIRTARTNQTLEITEETESFLEEIALIAEKSLNRWSWAKEEDSGSQIDTGKRADLSWVNSLAVDGLYMLLEEVRLFRKGRESLENTF